MKNILFCIIILIYLLPYSLYSQSYWSKRYDFDIGNDYGTQLKLMNDGAVAQIVGLCVENQEFCYGLMKFDFDGNLLWETIIHDTMALNQFESMVVWHDTIFLNMQYYWYTGKQYAVLSFDQNGQYISRFDMWQPNSSYNRYSRSLRLGQGGRIYPSFDAKDSLSNKPRQYIRCYDRDWQLLWDTYVPQNGYPNLLWVDTEITLDTGLVVCYTSWKPQERQVCTTEKYDIQGQLEWRTTLPQKFDNGGPNLATINALPDGTYMGSFQADTFGGTNTDHPILWFKLSATGELLWEKMNLKTERELYNTFMTQNGDIIGVGTSGDYYYDTIVEPYRAGYIVRMDSDGVRKWERKIKETSAGGTYEDVINGVELPNGDLMFIGGIDDTLQTLENPSIQDTWIFKTDSNGCFVPGCGDLQTLVPIQDPPIPAKITTFGVYPNPVTDHCILAVLMGEALPVGNYHIMVYNAVGQVQIQQEIDPTRLSILDTSRLMSGLYKLSIFKDGEIYQTLSLVK